MTKLPRPFTGPPPTDVPLARAPLVRVLAQIRFPAILSIGDAVAVASFQDRIRTKYPLNNKDIVQRIEIGAAAPLEPAAVKAETIWRFQSRDEHWRASLASNFLALDTSRYTSRHEFLGRMADLIEALEQTLNPQITQRIGLRYINRIENDAIKDVHKLIKPEILGPQQSEFGKAADHMMTESLLQTEEGALIHARWGILPAHATVDPFALEPVAAKSWILDFDMYSEAQGDFTRAALMPQLESYAKRIYAVFRYMITDHFLSYYDAPHVD
jgi:uncharacterized protein (TIGR04255 family)